MTTTNNEATIPEKKKRGRKKNVVLSQNMPLKPEEEKPLPKKRGRKPKGGKIVQPSVSSNSIIENEPNVILHLKCFLNDLDITNNLDIKYNPNIENIQSYTFEKNLQNDNNFFLNNGNSKECDNVSVTEDSSDNENDDDSNLKKIWKKVNNLKIKLHKNDICDKRSSCFWCTYDFDNPPIFIPKNEFKNTYQVYGCFCSPQCGVAYLMDEKIDSSIKYERYQLINHVYGKIFNYQKTIKPAPNPYYLLDKYYGNLSINEYRELFNTEQLLIVVEKPLSHVFPELYEDNSDFILNKKTIPSNSAYKLKRKSNSNKPLSIVDNLGINKS
jgi:hypothetical protein